MMASYCLLQRSMEHGSILTAPQRGNHGMFEGNFVDGILLLHGLCQVAGHLSDIITSTFLSCLNALTCLILLSLKFKLAV